VQTRGGAPDPRQEAAFKDRDVVAIVEELLRHDHAGLVRLARQAVIGDPPATRDEVREQLRGPRDAEVTDDQLDSAEAIWAAGARIFKKPNSDRLRGGLLERYVYEMVARRASLTVRREAEIELLHHPHSGRAWSRPKEVVVDAIPFEAYECKFGAGAHINQDDINEFGDIYLSAQAEELDPRPCLATMASEKALRARLNANGIQLDEHLYLADVTDLPVIGERPPSRRFR
jgi:hypothetical protein